MINVEFPAFATSAVLFKKIVFDRKKFWASCSFRSSLSCLTTVPATSGGRIVMVDGWREERVVLRSDSVCPGDRRLKFSGVMMGLLFVIKVVLRSVHSLSFCNMFRSEIGNSFQVGCDLVIQEGYL